MRKKIGVDMDDTLCQFALANYLAMRQNPDIKWPQSQYGFFVNLEPIPGAIEGYKTLGSKYDVFIVTRPSIWNPMSYTEKRVWVEKHLGFEECENLIMAPDKTLIKADYLIDDTPQSGRYSPEWEWIQLGSEKFPNWYVILNYLMQALFFIVQYYINSMAKTRFKAINYKGKIEYIWDPEGDFIRKGDKFIKQKVNSEEVYLKKEFQKLTKNKPFLKTRLKYIKNIEKKVYYAKVWVITEDNDLTVLKNHEKRGFRTYHLDHIFPISFGFKNNIPPEVIGNIDNLRFIHHKKNIDKGNVINEEAKAIIEKIIKKIQ